MRVSDISANARPLCGFVPFCNLRPFLVVVPVPTLHPDRGRHSGAGVGDLLNGTQREACWPLQMKGPSHISLSLYGNVSPIPPGLKSVLIGQGWAPDRNVGGTPHCVYCPWGPTPVV